MSTSKTEPLSEFSNSNILGNKPLPSSSVTGTNQIFAFDAATNSWKYKTNTGGSSSSFMDLTTNQTAGGIKSFQNLILENSGMEIAPLKNLAINTFAGGADVDIRQTAMVTLASLNSGLRIKSGTNEFYFAWDVDGFSLYTIVGGVPQRITSLSGGGIFTFLTDPVANQDACTKIYIDGLKKKNYDGHIPPLLSTTATPSLKSGFLATASSSYSVGYLPDFAFSSTVGGNSEWVTASATSNQWLQIQCPSPVSIWKLALRGRPTNNERIYNWRFEGSNNGSTWTTIFTAPNPTYLGNTVQQFIFTSLTPYSYYRIFIVQAEPTNPGLSYMQIYTFFD